MKTLGNLIWFVFGGLFVAIEYVMASFFLFITIIGIPFGLQTLKLAVLAVWPFGKEISRSSSPVRPFSTIMNIIWLIVGGFWICCTHLIFGIFFSITIIGLPFGLQHFKLAQLALTPFGRDIR